MVWVLPSYQIPMAGVARRGNGTYSESQGEMPHLRQELAYVGHAPAGAILRNC